MIELANYSNTCGEGPIWDASKQRLLWLDADAEDIFEYLPDHKKSGRISSDLRASSIVLDSAGLILLGNGIWVWPDGGEKCQTLDSYEGEELFFNDSVAGPDGNIYAGTYYWGDRMQKHGKLYRISPGFEPEALDEGIMLSNGLAFSAGNDILYYADSAARCIYSYDFCPGSLKNKRVHIRFGEQKGIPDGITVDSEGFLWCALWYGGVVERYDPDGKLERSIAFPVKQVSSVAFGDEDLTTLFVTSAGGFFQSDLVPSGFSEEACLGGALYASKPGVCGKPENIVDFGLKEYFNEIE